MKPARQTCVQRQKIDSLQLQVSITLMADSQQARVVQMTQKTNQFNFTTERLQAFPPPRTLPEQMAALFEARVARVVRSRVERWAGLGALVDAALALPEGAPLLIPPATVEIH